MLAALAALAALRTEAGFVLHCAHVEHGIRPAAESRGDAQAVEELCAKLDVPCRVISIPQGKIAALAASGGPGIEAVARVYRQRALSRERRRVGAEKILIAHTRDDLMETLLMRILRGAGPAGLAAMPMTRGYILRPLLDLRRKDVLAYLEEKGLAFRTDSTNADIRFLRNRVRLKLVPLLDAYFPSWRSSLFAMAETQSLTAEFLVSEAGKRLPWEKINGKINERASLRLREADFFAAPPILREEAVFAGADMLVALKAAGESRKRLQGQVPRRAAVRRAAQNRAALGRPEGQGTAGLSNVRDLGPVRLRKQNGYIEMEDVTGGRGERGFALLIKEAGLYALEGRIFKSGKSPALRIQVFPSGEAPIPGVEFIAPEFIARFPVVFRNYREGDRVYRGGHRRRFSDILDRSFRSEYTGITTACDAEGPVALFGMDRRGELLMLNREDAAADASEAGTPDSFLFKVSLN